MPWPTFHLTISGSVVALYAAVVSTLTGMVQISNYFRDRANIRVTVQHQMEIYGDPHYKDKTLTIVNVINRGRRPVTITTVGAYRVHPHDNFILTDCSPALPHELTEGKSLVGILASIDMDFSTIDYWHASDAVRYLPALARKRPHVLVNHRATPRLHTSADPRIGGALPKTSRMNAL
jgi:hypothetical protein